MRRTSHSPGSTWTQCPVGKWVSRWLYNILGRHHLVLTLAGTKCHYAHYRATLRPPPTTSDAGLSGQPTRHSLGTVTFHVGTSTRDNADDCALCTTHTIRYVEPSKSDACNISSTRPDATGSKATHSVIIRHPAIVTHQLRHNWHGRADVSTRTHML